MTQAKRSRLNPLGALVLTRERIQEVLMMPSSAAG
jgi:hypothetical protein